MIRSDRVSQPALAVEHIPRGPRRETYLPLLLLADDAEAQVRGYYQDGELHALYALAAGELPPVGVVPGPAARERYR